MRWMQEMDASCFIAFLDFGSNHFMHLHFSLFIKSTTTTTFLPFPSVPFDGPLDVVESTRDIISIPSRERDEMTHDK